MRPFTLKQCIVVLILIHAIFFLLAIHFNSIYLSDSFEYLFQAENLHLHHSYYANEYALPLQEEYQTVRTPIYGLFIYLTQWISTSHFWTLFIQNILSISTLTSLLYILKKNNTALDWKILLSLILFPSQMIYSNMIMSEIVFQLILFWSFLFLWKYSMSKNLNQLLVYNLLLAAAVYTKPVMMYFWVINMFLMLYFFLQNRKISILLFAFILPLSILLLCWRNFIVTDYFHFSYIKTNNLYNYNTEILLEYQYGASKADSITDQWVSASKHLNFKERCEYLEEKSIAIIRSNWVYYLLLQVRGMFRFFIDPGRYDIVSFIPSLNSSSEISFFGLLDQKGFKGITQYFNAVSIPFLAFLLLSSIWNVYTLFLFVKNLFNTKINFLLRSFATIYIFYICFMSGPLGCSRFKLAIFPIFILIIFFSTQHLKNSTHKAL
ncbi:MAG: hypothetical protein M3Q56_01860 [Bacteroidota bacterium]|nr:hypothetical protein [Bacteroidota bacterium]